MKRQSLDKGVRYSDKACEGRERIRACDEGDSQLTVGKHSVRVGFALQVASDPGRRTPGSSQVDGDELWFRQALLHSRDQREGMFKRSQRGTVDGCWQVISAAMIVLVGLQSS